MKFIKLFLINYSDLKALNRTFFTAIQKNKVFGSLFIKTLFLKKYFLEFIIILKNKLETFTGYKYSQIQDALTIGTLLTIITKLSSVIFIDYRIPILINLTFLLFYFLFSLKFNLIYYVRESLAYLLSVILGEKVQFKEESFCCIYYEEDAWRIDLPKNIKTTEQLSEFINTYEKVPGLKYNFIEPTENIFNRFFQYICIFLIYIKLLTLKIPIIFYCIKTILFFMLITNHLLPLTYIISIVLIFSRILLLLSDFTMDNIYHSYHEFKKKDSYWTGEYIEATTIPVNFNNACVFFIWAIRALEKEDRNKIYTTDKFYPNRSLVFINETMWNVKYVSKYQNLLINYEDKSHYYMFNFILLVIIINFKAFSNFFEFLEMSDSIVVTGTSTASKSIGKVIFRGLNYNNPMIPIDELGILNVNPKERHKGWFCSDDKHKTIFTSITSTKHPGKNYPNSFPQLLKTKNNIISNYCVSGVVKAHRFQDFETYTNKKVLIEKNIDLNPTRDLNLEIYTYDCLILDMELRAFYFKNIPGFEKAEEELIEYFGPSDPSSQLHQDFMFSCFSMSSFSSKTIDERLYLVSLNIEYLKALLRAGKSFMSTQELNLLQSHLRYNETMLYKLDFSKANILPFLTEPNKTFEESEKIVATMKFIKILNSSKFKSENEIFDAGRL